MTVIPSPRCNVAGCRYTALPGTNSCAWHSPDEDAAWAREHTRGAPPEPRTDPVSMRDPKQHDEKGRPVREYWLDFGRAWAREQGIELELEQAWTLRALLFRTYKDGQDEIKRGMCPHGVYPHPGAIECPACRADQPAPTETAPQGARTCLHDWSFGQCRKCGMYWDEYRTRATPQGAPEPRCTCSQDNRPIWAGCQLHDVGAP